MRKAIEATTLIGYSGHAFVVADVILATGRSLYGYFEREQKTTNPYKLKYLGEDSATQLIALPPGVDLFVAVGNNHHRKVITERLLTCDRKLAFPALHPSAVVSPLACISAGVLLAPQVTVNALAKVEVGVILNTSSIIEHECVIEAFAHIAPGAVLAGNVRVGEGAFVGANAIIKQGVNIGQWSTIGAGAVVLEDVAPRTTVIGNPAKRISPPLSPRP
ncbi:acetyltransferase [Lewinella sp. JB7]|uniref:acetyltransferase n=1 Tax=Lewinella sp. JB7 TaxID=2962887 RepID=UPI0035322758